MSQTVAITGNTYPVKDQIKALGGRWNPDQKAWMVPADKADQARSLVTGAPQSSSKPGFRKSRGKWTGCSCGSVEEYERASDCWGCKHERY